METKQTLQLIAQVTDKVIELNSMIADFVIRDQIIHNKKAKKHSKTAQEPNRHQRRQEIYYNNENQASTSQTQEGERQQVVSMGEAQYFD